jgi:hypothetical protein
LQPAFRRRRGQPSAPARERRLVDGETLEIPQRVLHHGAWETPAERHLGGEHGIAQRRSVRGRHQRRDRQVA